MDPKERFKIEYFGYLQNNRFHCRGPQNLPLCEKKPFLAIKPNFFDMKGVPSR